MFMANRRKTRSVHVRTSSGWLTGVLALGTGLFRLFAFVPNFSPVGAMGLFAGARMAWWQALAIPLAVMAGSDLLLQAMYGYTPFHMAVYASMAVNVVLGRLLLRRTTLAWKIGGVSLLASVQFFFITNLGVWWEGAMYPRTLAGLLQCYVAALPFFQSTLLGDLMFSGVMFGAHAFVTRTSADMCTATPELKAGSSAWDWK
jgi:hypothetical protein